MERSIDIILHSIDALKRHLLSNPFNSVAEEILFFKQIKPKFISKLIYNFELLKSEGRRAIRSFKAQQKYLMRQLGKLKSYFQDNIEFYQYYRSGNTFLDEKHFVRNVFDILSIRVPISLIAIRIFQPAMISKLPKSSPMTCFGIT